MWWCRGEHSEGVCVCAVTIHALCRCRANIDGKLMFNRQMKATLRLQP